jgi:hypothetical protein
MITEEVDRAVFAAAEGQKLPVRVRVADHSQSRIQRHLRAAPLA